MEVVLVDGQAPDPLVVARAALMLARGALLIYPTDTLYALGGRALDARAVGRVRAAKGREARKPLPLVAADPQQARALSRGWGAAAEALAAHFWPGPLTLVLPAGREVPEGVTAGGSSVAVRVPALVLARALCAQAGPLVSTSANRSGSPAALTCGEAVAAVGAAASWALDAGSGHAKASTIVDVTGEAPRLLRAGAVRWEEILRVLRSAGAC